MEDCGVSVGCFRDPPQCDSFQNCNNFLVWNDTGSNTIDFFISAKINNQNTQGKDNFWTSISFNTDTKMVSIFSLQKVFLVNIFNELIVSEVSAEDQLIH